MNTAAGAGVKELGGTGVVSRYKTIGVTTKGAIEDAGGKVVPKPIEGNPYHAEVFDILRARLVELLDEIKNPGFHEDH